MNERSERYKNFLETMTPKTLENLKYHVSNDVHFKDTLNYNRGIDDIKKVFNHMFLNVKKFKFAVNYFTDMNKICLIQWKF